MDFRRRYGVHYRLQSTCVGSFTCPGIDTQVQGTTAFSPIRRTLLIVFVQSTCPGSGSNLYSLVSLVPPALYPAIRELTFCWVRGLVTAKLKVSHVVQNSQDVAYFRDVTIGAIIRVEPRNGVWPIENRHKYGILLFVYDWFIFSVIFRTYFGWKKRLTNWNREWIEMCGLGGYPTQYPSTRSV